MHASNKKGLTVPWPYVRRALAQRWGIPPWGVDEAPVDEVMLELRLMELDGEEPRKR